MIYFPEGMELEEVSVVFQGSVNDVVVCRDRRSAAGTLYTLLAKFQEEKLIEETQVDGRKRTYRITDKGRSAFREELERLRACVLDGEEEFL